MVTRRRGLKDGKYQPATNRGKNGKPARLTTFFYRRCLLAFPAVFEHWKNERTDKFVRHTKNLPDGFLAQALGQAQPDAVPENVAHLCDTITKMINKAKPRVQAVWRCGGVAVHRVRLGPDRDAEKLEIKVGDVETPAARSGRRSATR